MMDNKRFLIVIGLLFFTLANYAYGTSFVLKSSAIVFDEVVKMRDIALMDKLTKLKIGELVISSSPNIGKQINISKREIYEKLIGNGVSNPVLKGAKNISVNRRGKLVNTSFFKKRILDYIKKYSRWKNGLTLKIITNKKIIIPLSGVSWKIIPVNGQDFFGNILFKLRAFKNGEEVLADWIVARLKIEKKVAIANRIIRKDEMIRQEDIRWEEREITAFTKNAIFEKIGIIGQRAGRTIRTNTVITTNNLESKYLVKRGFVSSLIVRYKSIRAVADVIPMSNGKYGDIVKVMNKNTKKILSAIVIGQNKMEVKVR
jgi:flagella basal body P-ring formation protein FlgA